MEEPWIAFANAFAGFYAASLWGFFAVMRARGREWWWALFDVILAGCSIVAGLAYFLLATNPPASFRWFELLRFLVVPILVLPTTLHFATWRHTRAFIFRAEAGGDEDVD